MTESATTSIRWHLKAVRAWTVVRADARGTALVWLDPSWYRRTVHPDGTYEFAPLSGWRLAAHRLLWGFHNLVDAR